MSRVALGGQRVMVVEDELLVAMMIEDLLTDHGCMVVGTFATVSEALAAAQHLPLDLAVLDVNLRGEKVYPVAEVLQARGIPFLLLSGYGEQAIPVDHPDWRACSKPFHNAELVGQLTRQLAERPGPHSTPS